MANDSVVDERTFREIYTTGFEIAVKEGKAKSIMSSYNEVNGVYANENRHMLQEILVVNGALTDMWYPTGVEATTTHSE